MFEIYRFIIYLANLILNQKYYADLVKKKKKKVDTKYSSTIEPLI